MVACDGWEEAAVVVGLAGFLNWSLTMEMVSFSLGIDVVVGSFEREVDLAALL